MAEAPSPSDEGTQEPKTPDAADAADTPEVDPAATSATDTTETPDANDPANSSPADGPGPTEGSDAKGPQTLLEAVEAAVKPTEDADPSPAEGKQDAADQGDKPDADAADKDDADGKKAAAKDDDKADDEPPPFHEHPRWKQLVEEKAALEKENAGFKEANDTIDRLEIYMNDQNLSTDDFNNLLHIGSLVKNDPKAALEALTPLVAQLQEVTGNTIPADIQQAIDQGHVTEDYGRQLAVARATTSLTQVRADRSNLRLETEQQATAVNALGAAASTWEGEWQANDPDYPAKADRVREKIELAIHRGDVPQDAKAVRAMCEKFKGEVETELRSLLPKPKAVAVSPTSTTGGGPSTGPKPANLFEVIEQTVGAGQA